MDPLDITKLLKPDPVPETEMGAPPIIHPLPSSPLITSTTPPPSSPPSPTLSIFSAKFRGRSFSLESNDSDGSSLRSFKSIKSIKSIKSNASNKSIKSNKSNSSHKSRVVIGSTVISMYTQFPPVSDGGTTDGDGDGETDDGNDSDDSNDSQKLDEESSIGIEGVGEGVGESVRRFRKRIYLFPLISLIITIFSIFVVIVFFKEYSRLTDEYNDTFYVGSCVVFNKTIENNDKEYNGYCIVNGNDDVIYNLTDKVHIISGKDEKYVSLKVDEECIINEVYKCYVEATGKIYFEISSDVGAIEYKIIVLSEIIGTLCLILVCFWSLNNASTIKNDYQNHCFKFQASTAITNGISESDEKEHINKYSSGDPTYGHININHNYNKQKYTDLADDL